MKRRLERLRDSNRLQPFYEKIEEFHRLYVPDWRFGQLIINFCGWLFAQKGIQDIFYIEDDKMAEYIEEYFNSMKARN